MKSRLAVLAFIWCLMMASGSWAYNILVWDADLGDQYYDPDTQQLIGSEVNLVSALTNCGQSPQTVTTLPGDLTPYDMVFVCTGWYTC
jgi:hypothetical protein